MVESFGLPDYIGSMYTVDFSFLWTGGKAYELEVASGNKLQVCSLETVELSIIPTYRGLSDQHWANQLSSFAFSYSRYPFRSHGTPDTQ